MAAARAFAAVRSILLLGSVTLAACFSASAETRITWGANGHPIIAYSGVAYDDQIALLADLGMRSYRVNVPTVSSGDKLALLVAAAKTRGVEILPVLTPDLDLDKLAPDDLYRSSFALAEQLVTRFKDDIRVWELGNEMENYAIVKPCEMRENGQQYPCQWGPAGGTGYYDYYGPRWAKVSAVLKGLSDGAASADPTVRRAMGTAGWGHIAAFERMKNDGIQWDISVWHMYGEDPEWAFKILAGYGHPIWITELNQPYGSAKGDEAQVNGLRRWMARLEELAPVYRIEVVHIYELLDEPYWAPDYEASMGLFRLEADGDGAWRLTTPKPAYFSVRAFVTGRPASEPAPGAQAQTSSFEVARGCSLERMGDLGGAVLKQRITYAYCLVLQRRPDPGGLNAWLHALSSGQTDMNRLLIEMAGSREFRNSNPALFASHEAYVAAMYKLLLGRDPDPGAGPYVRGLESGKLHRTAFLRALLESAEFRQRNRILFEDKRAAAQP